MPRKTLRAILLCTFVGICVFGIQNFYRVQTARSRIETHFEAATVSSKDIAELRSQLHLSPQIEDDLLSTVTANPDTDPVPQIVAKLMRERRLIHSTIDEQRQLLNQATTQALIFVMLTGYLILLSWRLMHPKVQQGLTSKILAEAKAKLAAANQREADVDVAVEALLAPLRAEVQLQQESVGRDAAQLQKDRRQLELARSELQSARQTFDLKCARRATDWQQEDLALKARETACQTQLSDATKKLERAGQLTDRLQPLLTRLDGYGDLRAASAELARTLAAEPDLPQLIAEHRT